MSDPCTRCGYSPWPNQRTWTLVLQIEAISQNKLGGYGRGRSGWKYRSTKRAYSVALSRSLRGVEIQPCTVFRRAVVTRYFKRGCRPFDHGNLVGGFKPLIDTLREKGLIVDDSPKYFQAWYTQERSPDNVARVTVTLEEQLLT